MSLGMITECMTVVDRFVVVIRICIITNAIRFTIECAIPIGTITDQFTISLVNTNTTIDGKIEHIENTMDGHVTIVRGIRTLPGNGINTT